MKGRNWGRNRLCVTNELRADSVTSLGYCRYEFFLFRWQKQVLCSFYLNHFLKLKTISVFKFTLCNGMQAGNHLNRLDLGFWIRDWSYWISHSFQWNTDSGFQSLYRFQSPGFRTPEAKFFRIPRFRSVSYIGRYSSTSFLSSIPPLKTQINNWWMRLSIFDMKAEFNNCLIIHSKSVLV